ncbi:MAG TPA: efflux RND transporter periplasmic adaptor subunit [Caulobacterales bacterium]|nr:efflux RND transporter periplasmic adaptor subunit [Caulobacterales bacterium]
MAGAIGLVALMVVAGGAKLAFSAVTGGANAAQGRGAGGRMTQVSAVAAEMRPFTDTIEALGVAKGRQSVDLTANTTELITRVRFHDGDMVRQGAVLVDLKAREEAADVSEARAAVDVARSTYDRYERLAQAGFLSPAAMDQYRANLQQAEASLAAAQSREQDRVIRAPFAGRLGLTDVAPGALVNPGAVIVTLDDVSVMRVDFDVPDRFLPVLHVGAPIKARPDPYPDRIAEGRIADVDSRIDPNTHAIRARAEFPNPDNLLIPGMLMHVAIENGERQSVAVPEAAVQAAGDQSFVYVIAHDGQRTIARQTPVQIGVNENGFVEIRSGLAEGARVVADGLDRVEPNAPIRVAGERMAGGAGLRGRESQ